MIVDHFNVTRPRVRPSETDPILVVDPDAVLTLTIPSKRLETVPWWYSQIVQYLGLVESIELLGCAGLTDVVAGWSRSKPKWKPPTVVTECPSRSDTGDNQRDAISLKRAGYGQALSWQQGPPRFGEALL